MIAVTVNNARKSNSKVHPLKGNPRTRLNAPLRYQLYRNPAMLGALYYEEISKNATLSFVNNSYSGRISLGQVSLFAERAITGLRAKFSLNLNTAQIHNCA
jgi:hypothetical protein